MTNKEVLNRVQALTVSEAAEKLEEAKQTGNAEVIAIFEAVYNLAKSREEHDSSS